MNDTLKTCVKCKQIKLITDFGTDRTTKSGLQSWCRSCKAAWARQYYHTPKGRLAHNRSRSQDYKTNRQRQAELLDAAKKILSILHGYNKILQFSDNTQSTISRLSVAVHQVEIA